MGTALLTARFDRIGARLKVADRPSHRSRTSGAVSLDVRSYRRGEFFEIVRRPGPGPNSPSPTCGPPTAPCF